MVACTVHGERIIVAWSNHFCNYFRKLFDFVQVCWCLDVLSNKTNCDLLLMIYQSIPENIEIKGIFTTKSGYNLL